MELRSFGSVVLTGRSGTSLHTGKQGEWRVGSRIGIAAIEWLDGASRANGVTHLVLDPHRDLMKLIFDTLPRTPY